MNDDDKRMTFKTNNGNHEDDEESDNEFTGEQAAFKKRSKSYADETSNDLKGPVSLHKQSTYRRPGSMSSIQQVLSITAPQIQSLYYLEYMIKQTAANKTL